MSTLLAPSHPHGFCSYSDQLRLLSIISPLPAAPRTFPPLKTLTPHLHSASAIFQLIPRQTNPHSRFTTKQGQIQLVEDGRGNFLFYGAGVHMILDPFYSVKPLGRDFGDSKQGPILHGDRTIVVVEQVGWGQIGLGSNRVGGGG